MLRHRPCGPSCRDTIDVRPRKKYRENSCTMKRQQNKERILSMSTSIAKTQRYLPHTLETRFHAVKTYRSGFSVKFVARRYKISKASLMRWNRRFDGTIDSLRDRSHRPKTPHTNAHTPQEKTWIKNLIRRNPTISLIELYAILNFQRSYQRHPCSLFRFLRKQGFYKEKPAKKKAYAPKPYDTPKNLGIKWQLDVKYFPKPAM